MCDFEVYRAQIPAPFQRGGQAPMITRCFAPDVCVQALVEMDQECGSDGCSASDYIENRTVTIWFFNRHGWMLAHRLIRRLARGTVAFHELVSMNKATGNLTVIPHEFRSDHKREAA